MSLSESAGESCGSSLQELLQQIQDGGNLYSQIRFHRDKAHEHETLARMHRHELQKLEKLQERTNEAAKVLMKED